MLVSNHLNQFDMKKIFITCVAILALSSSCSSILDEDLSSISEEQVWVDKH